MLSVDKFIAATKRLRALALAKIGRLFCMYAVLLILAGYYFFKRRGAKEVDDLEEAINAIDDNPELRQALTSLFERLVAVEAALE